MLDAPERNARVYPALILLTPALIAVGFTFPALPNVGATSHAAAAAILTALFFALTRIVRYLGLRYERTAWPAWGDQPGVRLLRWRDSQMTDPWKALAHRVVRESLGITPLSRDEEENAPEKADALLKDIFLQVRSTLNLHSKHALLRSHNIEYGFARNLCGGAVIGVALSLASAIWCMACYWILDKSVCAWGVLASVAFGAVLVILRLFWLPGYARLSADRFAEKAWSLFIVIKHPDAGQPDGQTRTPTVGNEPGQHDRSA